jgi:hypothetical protein
LFTKPKYGIILTIIIITGDVTHNNTIYFQELYNGNIQVIEWIQNCWMILGQIIFLFFVLFSIKSSLKEIAKQSHKTK